ncbi:UDP-glucose dehydrogenase family protein [Microlunatus speluncae]|uniref:UDP-glucose dehydrogenase family protein n=1 Tax=Microlunatus speluncae TaxID=2594267 RepID=UPI0012662141|nr:UDP-glucose/GDP-mannose dehydrogenase family protein [Microlunatus speluncae]
MLISVIGCGYLGAVHATCLAHLGHTVVGIDSDRELAARLDSGRPSVYEPELESLLTATLATGRLRFTADPSAAAGAEVHFLCVGTPQLPDRPAADLAALDSAVDALLPYLTPGDLVVGKSTVPVGTAERLNDRIAAAVPGASCAWNPEFLREGHAVADTLRPDRLVYGSAPDDERATAILNRVYASVVAAGTPVIATDLATAELVKVAANSFLATKISFINAMAEVCEAAGADVTVLADAIGHDERIGRQFLGAGLGFGGGCLPKDIRAFGARAAELGADRVADLLARVDEINLARRDHLTRLATEACEGSVIGRRIAILGAAFKPNSDDVRDSPALAVALDLQRRGAHVRVTDPQAGDNARKRSPELTVVDSVAEAVDDAEAVLLLTEWQQYRDLRPADLTGVRRPVIIDGRNALDPTTWREAGWHYRAPGRPSPTRQR